LYLASDDFEAAMKGSSRVGSKPESGADVLAERLRAALPAKGLSEQRMFGGIGFMLNGNMLVGTSKRGLLVRVGRERHAVALARPGASAMEMRGRPIEGYVFVDPGKLGAAALQGWLDLALAHARELPPKSPKTKPKPKKRGRK
jgi:hypothetical protein